MGHKIHNFDQERSYPINHGNSWSKNQSHFIDLKTQQQILNPIKVTFCICAENWRWWVSLTEMNFPEITQSSVNVYIHGTQTDRRQGKRKNLFWSDMAPQYFVVVVVCLFLKQTSIYFKTSIFGFFPEKDSPVIHCFLKYVNYGTLWVCLG